MARRKRLEGLRARRRSLAGLTARRARLRSTHTHTHCPACSPTLPPILYSSSPPAPGLPPSAQIHWPTCRRGALFAHTTEQQTSVSRKPSGHGRSDARPKRPQHMQERGRAWGNKCCRDNLGPKNRRNPTCVEQNRTTVNLAPLADATCGKVNARRVRIPSPTRLGPLTRAERDCCTLANAVASRRRTPAPPRTPFP